jgi:hypothetical protein
MAGNEYVQDYCQLRNIYNSQYLNDETKNVMKELESKKLKIESIKSQCKEDMTETLESMTKLVKETTNELDFNNEDLQATFSILGQINNVLSSRINDIKNNVFEKDNSKIEESYKKYIVNNFYDSPISYYSRLLTDIGYILDTSRNNELLNKLRDLHNTSKIKLDKLNALLSNNSTSMEGEE